MVVNITIENLKYELLKSERLVRRVGKQDIHPMVKERKEGIHCLGKWSFISGFVLVSLN